MNELNWIFLTIGLIAGSIVGGVAYGFLKSRRPVEAVVLYKAGIALMNRITAIEAPPVVTPEEAAKAAAAAAHVAALREAFRDAAAKL